MNTTTTTTPIVIDNGSHELRGGFGGEPFPRLQIANCVGAPKRAAHAVIAAKTRKGLFVGEDVLRRRGVLDIWRTRRPNAHSVDVDVLRHVWHYALLGELRVTPEEHTLVVVDAPQGFLRTKCALLECAFEDFGFEGVTLTGAAQMSAYAHGRMSGFVVDIGEASTRVEALYQGYTIEEARRTNYLGGSHLDGILKELVLRNGDHTTYPQHFKMDSFRQLKEKYCSFKLQPNAPDPADVELSDGTTIRMDDEQLRCVDALFSPVDFYVEAEPLHELIRRQIQACPVDARKYMRNNIMVCGGTALIKNFKEKLSNLLPANYRILESKEKNLLNWIGASVYTSLDSFSWIPKEAYTEYGPGIIGSIIL